ncbi:Cor superinfection exclusion protein [Yersinia phage phiR2-01]|uniref:Receptor-blocking protein n=1 Tax=Yersinia phage phiR2-01 TaxID=1206557 RepID=I7J3V3_9CAUD|nr:Cor superinfection exclusion protein [Yersinia phage phiR2-01]CCI88573.1 receptor-blocking protein [Yersinia phage phiR2-01]
MKKLLIAAVLLLTGCTTTTREPFCTAYVKTYEQGFATHYKLNIRDARTSGYRFPKTQLKTKYGWWELYQFDLSYGDCKVKLQQAGYL